MVLTRSKGSTTEQSDIDNERHERPPAPGFINTVESRAPIHSLRNGNYGLDESVAGDDEDTDFEDEDQVDGDDDCDVVDGEALYPRLDQNSSSPQLRVRKRNRASESQIPQIVEDQVDSPASRTTSWCNSFIILLVCFFLPTSCIYTHYNVMPLNSFFPRMQVPLTGISEDLPPVANKWLGFKESLADMKSKYHGVIPEQGWKVIKASVKDLLVAPEYSDSTNPPSTLLVLGKANDRNMSCFVRDIGRMLSITLDGEYEPVVVNGKTDSKLLLYKFDETFGVKKRHFIVVDSFEQLHGNAPTQLYRYTDHETAAYNNVVILLVGYSDKVEDLRLGSSSKSMDVIATDLIRRSWIKYIDDDRISGLLSRLTPSVIGVTHHLNSKNTVC